MAYGDLTPVQDHELSELTFFRQNKFGSVYHGIYKGQDRIFALSIKTKRTANIRNILAACHEMSCMAHPAMVEPFFGFCIYKALNTYFLIAKYSGFNTTHGLLSLTSDPVPCIQFSQQIAATVEFLHSRGILIKDLRLNNTTIRDGQASLILCLPTVPSDQMIDERSLSNVLYTAPEVLQHGYGAYSEKADIFSLGFLIYEMVSHEESYPNRFSYTKETLLQDLLAGIRPKRLPVFDTFPGLWEIIECCWSTDKRQRLSAKSIAEALKRVFVRTMISDDIAYKMWLSKFTDSSVPFSRFWEYVQSLYMMRDSNFKINRHREFDEKSVESMLDIELRNWTNDFADPEKSAKAFEVLKKRYGDVSSEHDLVFSTNLQEGYEGALRLALDPQNTGFVTQKSFGKLFDYFGPLSQEDDLLFLIDRLRRLFLHPWFHADIDTADCERMLLNQKQDSFLVRYSSNKNAFTFSRSIFVEGQKTRIIHCRVTRDASSNTLTFNNHVYPSLEAIILHSGSFTMPPCPRSSTLP